MRSVLAVALGLAACAPRAPAGPAAPPAQTEQPATGAAVEPAAASPAAPAGPGTGGGQEPGASTPDGAAPADPVVAAIEQAINDTHAARHACWARGAADSYKLAGRVVLRVQFGAAGAPVVTVRDDEPQDPVLTQCLVALYEGHAWPDVFAPGTAVELPFAFQTPRYQYTVQAEHVPAQNAGNALAGRAVLTVPNTGNDDLALVLLESERVNETRKLMTVTHDRTTTLLYVIDGQAEILPAAGRAGPRVAAGQAISIPPGTPYAVRAAEAPLRAAQIFVPMGPDATGRPATAPARGRRGARLPAVQAAPQIFPIAGGQAEIALYLDRASGHEAASLAVVTARPGMRIPPHVHERETEMVLVLAGTGTMTVDGDTYPIAPMTAIQIPPGIEHAVEIDGAEPLRALQVYTPSGPEQRFKQPAP